MAHDAHAGVAPRSQPARTARAGQAAGPQGAFDFRRVGSYDLHVASGHQEGASRHSPEQRGRVLARTGFGTLSPDAEKGNPKVARVPSPACVSLQAAHVFSPRGAQHTTVMGAYDWLCSTAAISGPEGSAERHQA